jgi:hypothetical protein
MAHGRDLVEEARKLARSPEMHDQIEAALCDALAFLHLPVGGWRLKQVAKGIAKMVAVSDPLAELWRTDGHRVLAQ